MTNKEAAELLRHAANRRLLIHVNGAPHEMDPDEIDTALRMAIAALDAVEVRHAYWKNDHESQTTPLKDGYNCSACGEPATTAYHRAVRSRWCPWCGARMDGEDGDA